MTTFPASFPGYQAAVRARVAIEETEHVLRRAGIPEDQIAAGLDAAFERTRTGLRSLGDNLAWARNRLLAGDTL